MLIYPWGISEDDLTGDFFGLMKYLPANALFTPFLGMIESLYPDRNINPKHTGKPEILLWPEYEIPKEWRDQFNLPNIPVERRRSKYYIVPDVVIHIGDYTFIVEAEKSHSVEAEQLFQQYLIGRRLFLTPREQKRRLFSLLVNTDQMPPYSCQIAPSDRPSGISILPSDSIPRYIEKRAQMVGEACDIKEISHSLLWISWHHIGKLAEDVLDIQKAKGDEISKLTIRFLAGFKEMMDKEGFYPVKVFRADEPFEGSIEPTLIPTFQLLPNLVRWLNQQVIQPESIRVLNKGGN